MENVNEIIKANTLKSFEGKVDSDSLDKLIQAMPDYKFEDGVYIPSNDPGLISAKASLKMFLIYGEIDCYDLDGYKSTFGQKIWGLGAGSFDSVIGGIYNVYENSNWPYFFRRAAGAYVQGFAGTIGTVQITWFDENKVPIGQFNSAAVGAGVFGAGCDGHWNVRD